VAFNGVLLYEIGKAVYHGARVVTRDEDAYALYYDYLTLVVLAASTDEQRLARRLEAALVESFSRFVSGDAPGARSVLAEPLAQESTSDFTRLGDRARSPRHGVVVAAAGDAPQVSQDVHPRAQHHRPAPGLRLRHEPTTAAVVDEAPPATAVRAHQGCDRRWADRAPRRLLGRAGHQPAQR